jgi:hypothetical protein
LYFVVKEHFQERRIIMKRKRTMSKSRITWLLVFVLTLVLALGLTFRVDGAVPHIVSTSPAQNELNVLADANISVTFDVQMDDTTINSSTFIVNARSTGLHQGTFSYNSGTYTATLDPNSDFDPGEIVTVVLTTGIQSSDNTPLENYYAWSFTIEVNVSPGRFLLDSTYEINGFRPFSIFAADFDGDGDVDLATANSGSEDVSVLLNDGTGVFTASSVCVSSPDPGSVFAGDLDADGDLDLATANWSLGMVGGATVLQNDGNGIFSRDAIYWAGQWTRSAFAADLDGDGDLDLAAAGELDQSVFVFLNNVEGTFADAVVYGVGVGPRSVFAADLDGDGDIDLTTANWYYQEISVLLNNGDGTFAPRTDYNAGGDALNSIFAADLDDDGDLDLVTANVNSDDVSVLTNDGNGVFTVDAVYPSPVQDGHKVFVADIDGDGDMDIITTNGNRQSVSTLLNNGDGTFAYGLVYPAGYNPHEVFAADLDGDGDLDLAIANARVDLVSVLFNRSDAPACTGPITTDLNGDCKVGLLDFAIFASEWLMCNLDPPEACWE